MANLKSQRNTHGQQAANPRQQIESPKKITHDVVDYLTDYARENPGTAALCCIGVGLVLGWKLKPW